jgi:hypothetical protein
MDFWTAITFFFAGALLGRFVARLLDVSHASIAYGELERSMLTMLMAVEKDMTSALETKYRALDAAEIPIDVISKIRKIDERVLAEWRDVALSKMILSLPPSFYRYAEYKTWEEAKKVIQERRNRDDG